jgi:hypothetical protein
MEPSIDNARFRGLTLAACGVGFVLVLMVGGGLLTATHAGYWCGLLWTSFVLGLVFPGLWLGPLARRDQLAHPEATHANSTYWQRVRRYTAIGVFQAVVMVASGAFFRSDFFANSLGMHLFVVAMGVCCGTLVMIGLGIASATSAKPKPIVDDWSS